MCVKRSQWRVAHTGGIRDTSHTFGGGSVVYRAREGVGTHCEQGGRHGRRRRGRDTRHVRVKAARPTEDGSARDSGFVQSLQRGLAVIRAFDTDNPALTLSDVAKATDLAPATARRFVLTLVELGYMRTDGRLFRLSPRVLELGRPYLSSLTLPAIARPHLRDFVADVRESSSLAILDGSDIVYIAHETARRVMSVQVTVGTRDPAFATSLGRVLIAGRSDEWLSDSLASLRLTQIMPATIAEPGALLEELRRIRAQGFALVDQEFEEGLRALAAPIHDIDGNVIAAVNVAVHASRWSIEAIHDDLLPRLVRATAAIDADVRDVPASAPAVRSAPPEAAEVSEPTADLGDRETDFVQSLQRGIAVIRAFDAENPALTLSDVARVTGLARAAARRFVLTLVELGYMRADGRLFRLSPRVLELGRPYLTTLTLPEVAAPHLRDLVDDVQESSSVATLDGDEIVYVAHVSARRMMSVSVTVGTRDPAFATSLGRALLAGQSGDALARTLARIRLPRITDVTIVEPKALLAELRRTREQGFALVDQELEEGLRALAVPLHDEGGDVIASVNLAVNASRWSIDRIHDELLPRLLETAAEIERDLRAIGMPVPEPLVSV
jgi:IclR family transcriptional regulator, pca regulon regulatory protein